MGVSEATFAHARGAGFGPLERGSAAMAGFLPFVSSEGTAATDGFALIAHGERWGFARLAEAADRLAAGMVAQGVARGDRVALHLRSGPEIAIAYLACFRLGAIAAPLNIRFKQPELADAMRRLRPRLYLGQAELYRHVAAIDPAVLPTAARFLVDRMGDATARSWMVLQDETASLPPIRPQPHAPAVLLLTSGTTGQPKFVAHSLASLAQISDRAAHLGMRGGQVHVFALPMVHASGLSTFLRSLYCGLHLVLCDPEPDAMLDSIERYRCDTMMSLPAMAALLVQAQRTRPRDTASLRLCLTAGDVCPPGLQAAFRSTFGRPLFSLWASTEAGGSCTYDTVPGAVSLLAPGTELRLVDSHGMPVPQGGTGEMLLRGSHIMLGYWRGPGVIDGLEDGWYRSGDLMRQDGEGRLWFEGRVKDLIIRGGSNISPVEVEAVVGSHPAVAEVAVIGVPDPVLGQRVMGVVRLHDGADAAVVPAILAETSSRLADYKVPERLLIVADALPRNGLGKLDRPRLAAMAAAALQPGHALQANG